MSDKISNINENYIGGDILDGQWVQCYKLIFSGNFDAYNADTGTKSWSLSDVLPQDGCTYLCQIEIQTSTNSKSSNLCYPRMYSGTISIDDLDQKNDNAGGILGLCPIELGAVRTRTASTRIGGSWCFLPLHPEDQGITVTQASDATGSFDIYLKAFRRMGTNR